MRAPVPPRQSERLAALRAMSILDTPREPRFDRIVELAAELCEAPIAVINLIDEDRQWFKAETGLGVRETPLEASICAHVILQPGLTIISDTLNDPRLKDNPLCIAAPNLRFYAGTLLATEDGLPLGTLCVLDHQPRTLTPRQQGLLTGLAEQVMIQIQLTRDLRLANDLRREVDHRVKNSLGLVGALLGLQAGQSPHEEVKTALRFARNRIDSVALVHEQLHSAGATSEVDMRQFVDRLATSLNGQAKTGVSVRADVPSVMLPARSAIHAGIVLNELATNALRHGLAMSSGGLVRLDGEIVANGLKLTVADNGQGLPDDFSPADASGLGMRLVLSLTRELGASLAWSSSPSGTTFSFEIPVTPADKAGSLPD